MMQKELRKRKRQQRPRSFQNQWKNPRRNQGAGQKKRKKVLVDQGAAPAPVLPQDREVGVEIGEEESQGGQGRGHQEGEEDGGTQAHQEADRGQRGGGARDLGQGGKVR